MTYPYFQVSKKSYYALRGLLELALRGDGEPVNVRVLAESQSIPARFLENILNELKQGGFVTSTRGKTGGFLLARPAESITVGDILRFLDRNATAKSDSGRTAPRAGDFVLAAILDAVNEVVGEICERMSLQEMVARHMKNQDAFTSCYVI